MNPTTDQQDNFVPFTTAERMQQLGQIDKDIAELLRSASKAIEALGKKEAEGGNAAVPEANPNKVFEGSMNDFIRGLRRVNVGMKRQILGLEEAGIISLRKDEGVTTDSQGTSSHQPRLEPDGEGKIGGLDVGWLNSHNSQIEQQTAAELWSETEAFLQDLLDKQHNLNLNLDADTGGN
ncbi:hypothetical protein SLS62_002959 [Diatrype stigma]|uniref:Mediator of RNA polymerase II transcription subunit 11 n=1 Tax=Diatrype stigma TaxID=117547 RepID=A0AAN9V5W3_9PEZI